MSRRWSSSHYRDIQTCSVGYRPYSVAGWNMLATVLAVLGRLTAVCQPRKHVLVPGLQKSSVDLAANDTDVVLDSSCPRDTLPLHKYV